MTDKKVDQFVHLHSHFDTSILDGYSTTPEVIAEVARLGQPAIAMTDHGNLHGIYDLYKHAKAAGIKPIAGLEAYMTPSIVNRHHRGAAYLADGGRDDVSGRGAYTHITLLAENNTGLKNLYQMNMLSYTEGFFQKNRIDLELLEQYGKGIIATTGCPSGEVQTRLRLGQEKEALAFAAKLQDILGKDNVYMELMEHGMASELERGVRSRLLDIAKKLNMPLVATNDLHYAKHSDAKAHEELLCVQTRSTMSQQPDHKGGTRFAFEGDEYYVKSRAEMEKYFDHLPEALNNTLVIAERCDITIEPDDTLRPTIAPPAGLSEFDFLRQEAIAGLEKRLPHKKNDSEYVERLNTELDIIKQKNYVGYFLVVSDFVRWGKFVANPPVPTGFGRGCLSADTNVLTPLGFKKIKDIQVGDTVFDELGNQVIVPQVFEYDCEEPLVEIKSYYGNKGNKMTSDHKVLVSKANFETIKARTSVGIKYKKEVNEPIWVRADEVEVGDLVVMPKLDFANNLKGFKVAPESTVMENRKLTHSVRNIAKSIGVSRNAVQDFINNGGIVRGNASAKIAEYLSRNNLTVESLIEQRTITTNIGKDFIKADADLGFVLGLFISDGYIRQDGGTTIGFAQNKSEDEGVIPAMLEKVFGLNAHVYDYKDKDLRQYTIRHKGVRELFANIFKDYKFNAQTKYIPSELMNSSEEFRRGLLEGLWYGDGTHKGKSKYTTVSESLAEGVYTLLLSLGLPASLGVLERTEKRPEFNKSGRESWTEYSVVTAHNFNASKMTRGRGFDGSFNYYRVREINIVEPEGKVYDFTVPTTNSYVTDSYVVHNSAAGSLLGYCLDITDVDPIKYDLLFERFINPERDSPPDIDMDFNDTDRGRVIEYVIQKYGREKVAQIATFGKIGAKAALKDTVRILEQPFSMGEELSKALPEPVAGHSITLHDVYDPGSERYGEAGEFRELVKKLNAQELVDIARSFEGRTRSTGVHAAALVVSTKPVVETVPMMQRQADGAMITQWDYPTCEGLGLLKVDFLGLRNLGIIANAIKNVEKTKGIKLDIQEIIAGEMDDPKTYEMLASGESLGVFQLDSCLAGDTLVSGRKISKLYEDYKNGIGIDTTYSIALDSGKRVRNKVLQIVQSGVKPVYRLVSESDRMIEATLEHRFMTDSGWKKLGDIDINVDKILVDQTVKTLSYKECLDCGAKLKSEQGTKPSERCYKCSSTYHSNPSKDISRKAIAKSRQLFYENGGEPWNKGLTKENNASLAVVSRKVQEKLNGRNIHRERLTEKEYEEYISEMSIRMSGKGNPMYGKATRISKSGYREDIGHYVRSTWEADYARVLNFIDEPYLYEPKTFELTREDGSSITYTPGFYLTDKDTYVEIKGFMREIDAEKIKLIQEQYDIKLEVIQSSEFAELQLKYKDLVNWECPRIPETTEWETIKSVTYVNEQMTYDISMNAPLNNFLANGFMVHNSGMRSLMKQLRPDGINDISALLALYRPGPMGVGAHTDYALRKNGEQEITPIHPELKEPLADILNETYGLICYQEQIMRIAQKVADYSLAQADNLRRAMGKKKKSILDAEYVPFSEGMKKNGYSDSAIKALWEILIPFADYGFNKCVSDRTKIRLADNTPMSAREIYDAHLRGEEIWLQAMWPDGEIKPHKVEKVVSTGVKEIWRVKTADNRTIEVTPDHRLLTTRGYIKAEDMVVGEDELIVGDKLYSEKQIENAVHNIRKAHNKPLTDAQINARHNNMMVWNSSDSPEKLAHNERNAERMRKYQAGLTFEDRSEHQKHINETTDRGDKTAAMMRERKSWLYENDEDFRNKTIEHLAKVRRDGYDSGSGFGKTCYASNGMMCDSLNELRMAEFLIENGIEFEMHKLIGKGECDFYFEGLYWEMDGMDRHISYFERKYGDIPFVVVTPEDYMERISDILKLEHARNGDLIVSIEKLERKRATIDIEMSEGGPKNYVTWKGIVSHNSHSVGYGVLSYLTAFLKANYAAEFMAALLTSVADDTDKTALYLEDCRTLGIKVTPPSINTSHVDYAPINDKLISFGFRAIRGVGEGAAAEIVEIRGDEPFKDVKDFVNRVPKTLANKRILEALTLGGAFDDLKVARKSMMESIPAITAAITKANKKPTKAQQAKLDQLALFEDYVAPEKPQVEFEIEDTGEYSKLEKLKLERHALGLYVSGHPLEGLDMDAASASKVIDFLEENIKPIEGWVPRDAKPFKIGGIVTSLSKKRTKKGDTFAIGTVEDLTGSIPFVMFPKAYADHGDFLKLDGVYQMSGFPRKRDIDGVSFTVDAIRPLEFSESGKLSLRVKLTQKQWESGKDAFVKRLERHRLDGPGSTNVIISIKDDAGEIWEETLDFNVKTNPALTQEIRELFGMLSIGRWRKLS